MVAVDVYCFFAGAYYFTVFVEQRYSMASSEGDDEAEIVQSNFHDLSARPEEHCWDD